MWTFPAGFLERSETTIAGAIRETHEEACAHVQIRQLYVQFDLAYISQIYQFFLADLSGAYSAGEETLDVRLFCEEEIPWRELAFPVIKKSLEFYFDDRRTGEYAFRHVEVLDRNVWLKD